MFRLSAPPRYAQILILLALLMFLGWRNLLSPSATATPTPQPWQTDRQTSELTGVTTVAISRPSLDQIYVWTGRYKRPTISVRCREQHIDLVFAVETVASYEEALGLDQATFTYRTDNGPLMRAPFLASADHHSYSIGLTQELYDRMRNGRRMVVGFTPINTEPVEFAFDLAGLANAMRPVIDACTPASG